MKVPLTQVKARQYAHELMEYLFSKEELEESEKLFVNFTNRGFYKQELKQPPRVNLKTFYDEMQHTYFKRRFEEV